MANDVTTNETAYVQDTRSAFERQQEARKAELYTTLQELGGRTVGSSDGIQYVDGRAIQLPTDPTKLGLRDAARVLNDAADVAETEMDYQKTFNYRPYDGAAAVERVLAKYFGLATQGAKTMTFFGPLNPDRIEVRTGINESIQVPWGRLAFPFFDGADLFIGGTNDREFGQLFHIQFTAKQKDAEAVQGFFKLVEKELADHSIYKGKAFTGIDSPRFFDPYKVARDQVVYNRDVESRLENAIWGPIRTADMQRTAKLPLNTKNLLAGPYGTGKTLALTITAQEALQAGWTFIQAKATEDLSAVLKTAVLYSPAVVAIEDIDLLAKDEKEKDVAALLELFDGMTMKNNEVMVVMTTNHAEDLHKGMLRAGRIDALINIDQLDQDGVERLIKVSVPREKLDPDTQYSKVYEAMKGFAPAFIRETFTSAQRAAIVRTGSADWILSTDDFVVAADTLRHQHDLHEGKNEPEEKDYFRLAFEQVVSAELEDYFTNTTVVDSDGDPVYGWRLGQPNE